MSDFDITLKLNMKGIDVNTILAEDEAIFKKAIKNLAYVAYDDIVQYANSHLVSARQAYIKSLNFEDNGNYYLISIDEPGLFFENGFKGFKMKEGLLSGPKHKTMTLKSGQVVRYNIIPFQHRPKSKDIKPANMKKHEELEQVVRRMRKLPTEKEVVVKDREGRPVLVGHVVAKAKGLPKTNMFAGMIKTRPISEMGKARPHHTFTTFRMITDNTDDSKWQHKGFKGIKAFDAVEKTLEERIDQIIETVLGV